MKPESASETLTQKSISLQEILRILTQFLLTLYFKITTFAPNYMC